MPNWCENSVVLRHQDPAEIVRAVEAFQRGELLSEMIPNPSGEWDYEWCCANWGTKWDVGGDGNDPWISDDRLSALFVFSSAWNPPITAYERMAQQGFRIEAMYYESGAEFAGIWDSEFGDEFYNLSNMDSGDVAQQLPKALDDAFRIGETMAEFEDEDEDEEPEPLTEWYTAGVEAAKLEPHVLTTKLETDHV